MGEEEGFGVIGREADRTEEKKPPAACLVKNQNNGSHQKISKNFHSKHTENKKKGSQNDYLSFSDIYFFYAQPLMLK